MKTRLHYIWKALFILTPFILGMIGFTMEGDSFLQAVYLSIRLYAMEQEGIPANAYVEIARWLAPLATAGSLVLMVNVLRRSAHSTVARLTGRSVAVYGPKSEKAAMLKALGIRGIDMDKRPVKANSYILLGEEKDNLDFYSTYLQDVDKNVYIKCSSLPAQASNCANLHLFSPEEIAARLFWKEYCPYELSVQSGHQLRIVLIGFGKLGKEMLLSGLQNNIFDAHQHIEYHVLGSECGFTQIYRELTQISDPVVFHPGPWAEQMDIIRRANMVIVAKQHDQLAVVRDLTLALPGKRIHVLSAQPEGTVFLADQAELVCFDWKQRSMQPERILNNRLDDYAKRINLRYAHLYDGVEETEKERDIQWAKLNSFTRYSNISAADYHAIQLLMLGNDALTDEKLERLAELEHIRWCRYHYLNNWTYGTPDNGKNKDAAKRIHRSLLPYAELPDSEKEKDRENIRILLSLDRETE